MQKVSAGGPRVAIVGCGRMGQIRAQAVNMLGGVPAVLCDTDIERARRLALSMEHNTTILHDWQGIDFSAVDALVICTPPFARGPLEQAAVEAGVPMFVEKPVGLSTEQCVPVLRALDNRHTITAVGYMNRYRRSVAEAIDRLKDRRIIAIVAYWTAPPYSAPWWGEPDLSGGPLNDYATHLIDLARYFAGDIRSVQGTASNFAEQYGGKAETGVVGVSFTSDAVGSLIYSSSVRAKSIAFDVIHDDGTLRLVGWELQLQGETYGDSHVGSSDLDDIFLQEMRAFLTAVDTRSTDPILSDYRDAFRTQQVVDGIRHAFSTGKVEIIP